MSNLAKPRLAIEDFDLGTIQGLAFFSEEASHAVNFPIGEDFDADICCRQLRGLADWIEWQNKKKGEMH